jgi:CheY-like chemotaxis protein
VVGVRDTGAGVDPGLGDEIFLPFVQAKQSLARTEGGLGLGLALVKGLVELHGGAVAVESGGPDRGALFTLRIPRLPARAPALERPPVAAGLARASVLVVDDNHDAAESLAELVRVLGYTADVAFDGPSAIANVGARPPDLVLCDVGLPGMSGYEVAQALRSDRRLAGVRLVAVTGYAQPEDRQRAFDAGFEHHIAKPADPQQLEQLLARSLAGTPSKGARAVARRPS